MKNQLDLFDPVTNFISILNSKFLPENESDEVEFKSSKGGFSKDFWKTYSAFSNTNGGVIILGVVEKKDKFFFDGLSKDQIDKYQKDFWSNVNNPNTISANLLSNNDVKVADIEGNLFLIFNLRPAERKHKPVYLTTNPFKNTYKRNYEGDYLCKDEEVRRMLADADLSFSPDNRILPEFSLEDIDYSSLKQYRQLFASVRPSHPWSTADDKDFLMQIGGYRKDRKQKIEGPTVAGMLMFGKYLSIIDEECCPKFFPDYRERLTDIDEVRWTDRIFPDGTWECNLFQFYKLVYPKLTSRLPKPFQLSKGLRKDDTPAHTAIREAFINSLIHTDYSAPGSIIIECKPDEFIFTNPGTLLVTIFQFYKGGISECRNVLLQKMFLMIGSAEKAGSGVNKIMSGWGYAHWRTPYLLIENEPDRIILHMPMFSTIQQSTLTELKTLFGEEVEALGKDELTTLALCQIEGEITNIRLQPLVYRHKTEITKLLQDLCKNGYLIPENKSRWTTYRLNTRRDPNHFVISEKEDHFVIQNVDNTFVNVDSTFVNVDSMPVSVDSSIANVDSSIANEDSSIANEDSSVSNEDFTNIIENDKKSKGKIETLFSEEELGDELIPKTGKKLDFIELSSLITKFCSIDYRSIEEISAHVKRDKKYLKNNILPRMIKEEKLFRLNPKKNPNQKYISKK
ncbi:MAG: putative DNA binding domain-containing protein [Bacteroidales bacterium]|nr:putative DNA binding domain-containing protein [Bacteroidales bacterium]